MSRPTTADDDDGDECLQGDFSDLCISGTKLSVPQNFTPVTEAHSTLPEDVLQAAGVNGEEGSGAGASAGGASAGGAPGSAGSRQRQKGAAGAASSSLPAQDPDAVRLGESGLCIPKAVIELQEMGVLLKEFNSRLRDLSRQAEEIHKKEERAQSAADRKKLADIAKQATECVLCTEKLSERMKDFPDAVWDIMEKYEEHELLQMKLEECEQRHTSLFSNMAGLNKEAALALPQQESALNDEHEQLCGMFNESFAQLVDVIKQYTEQA